MLALPSTDGCIVIGFVMNIHEKVSCFWTAFEDEWCLFDEACWHAAVNRMRVELSVFYIPLCVLNYSVRVCVCINVTPSLANSI